MLKGDVEDYQIWKRRQAGGGTNSGGSLISATIGVNGGRIATPTINTTSTGGSSFMNITSTTTNYNNNAEGEDYSNSTTSLSPPQGHFPQLVKQMKHHQHPPPQPLFYSNGMPTSSLHHHHDDDTLSSSLEDDESSGFGEYLLLHQQQQLQHARRIQEAAVANLIPQQHQKQQQHSIDLESLHASHFLSSLSKESTPGPIMSRKHSEDTQYYDSDDEQHQQSNTIPNPAGGSTTVGGAVSMSRMSAIAQQDSSHPPLIATSLKGSLSTTTTNTTTTTTAAEVYGLNIMVAAAAAVEEDHRPASSKTSPLPQLSKPTTKKPKVSNARSNQDVQENPNFSAVEINGESKEAPAKKTQVPVACTNCKKAHVACDLARPCRRCSALNRDCVDVTHKRRGRPRIRDKNDGANTAITTTVTSTLPNSAPNSDIHGHDLFLSSSDMIGGMVTAAINIPAGNSATPTVLKRKIDPMENDSRITKAHAYGVQYVESISFSTLTSISGGGGGSRREEQGFNTAHEFANPIVYRPSSHTDSKAFGNFSDKSEHGRPSHLQINQKSISGAGLVGALGIVIEPQQQQQHLQQQQNGTRHSASGSEAVHHPAPPQVRSFNQAMPIRTSSVPPPTSAPIAVRKYAPFDRNSNATFTQVTQQHQQHPPPPQLVRTLPYNPPQIQLHLLQNQPHDTRPGRPYPHYYHPTRSNSSHNSSVIATASFNAHNITRHGQSTTGTWKTLPSSTSSLSSSLSSTAIIGGSGGDRSINIYFARDGSIAKLGREVYQAWGLRPKELTAATRFSDIVMEGDDRIWIDRIFTEFFKPLPTSNILPKACDPVSGVSGASLDLEEAAVCGVTSSLLEEEEKKLNTAKEEKCNDDIIVHEEHKRVVRIFNKHSSRHEPYRVVAALTRITEIASTSPTKTYSENTYVLCSFTPTYC